MIENLNFVDFNDIYVIAVGLSMAYIVVESREKASFFSILSKITTSVKELLLRRKKDIKEEEERITTQIDYYIESGLLNDVTRGSLQNTNDRAKKEVEKIKKLEDFVEKKLRFHTKTEFLNIISFDCFFYGLFILFSGALQNRCEICIDGLIQIMLFTMGLLLIHCLWFERLEITSILGDRLETRSLFKRFILLLKWLFKPRIFLHNTILLIALIIGINNYDKAIIPDLSCGWLSIISVFTCFIGFIVYLIVNVLSNMFLSIVVSFRAMSIGISAKKAKEHKDEIKGHRKELDRIDQQLKEENLSQNIIIENN